MSPVLFEVIKTLEAAGIRFIIERTRPDAISLWATFVGERVEIDVFEDDHVEISRFRGNEDVDSEGLSLVRRIIDENNRPKRLVIFVHCRVSAKHLTMTPHNPRAGSI